MIKIISVCFILLTSSIFAEDLVNYSYQQSMIKAKAKKMNKSNSSKRRTCYIYVNINGNRDWKKYKHKLNTNIRNNRSNCKNYVIYKVIKNVNTNSYRTSAKNSSDKDYKINLGAIVEENSNIDIKIYTIVKNSKLNNGFSEQKVNTGIVDNSNDIDNVKYDVHSKIDNSEVGQQDYMSEVGLNAAKDFLTKDKDSPFD